MTRCAAKWLLEHWMVSLRRTGGIGSIGPIGQRTQGFCLGGDPAAFQAAAGMECEGGLQPG